MNEVLGVILLIYGLFSVLFEIVKLSFGVRVHIGLLSILFGLIMWAETILDFLIALGGIVFVLTFFYSIAKLMIHQRKR